jgi:hypothetical protein
LNLTKEAYFIIVSILIINLIQVQIPYLFKPIISFTEEFVSAYKFFKFRNFLYRRYIERLDNISYGEREKSNALRVFVDSNILVSAVLRQG